MGDPETLRLLVEELERHLAILRSGDPKEASRSLHALKGAASMAGEADLASHLGLVDTKLREDDPDARADAIEIVRHAAMRLRAGDPAVKASWPEPPAHLFAADPGALPHHLHAEYMSELSDRLARIDEALRLADPLEAARLLYRHVHTMKGAAGAVGDEPMAWFCHGLEERLRGSDTTADAAWVAVAEIAEWRGTLGGFVDDPENALLTLRGSAARSRKRNTSVRPTGRPDEDEDATIRVARASVDVLFDQLVSFDVLREKVASRGERSAEKGQRLRRARADLADALRLIGPPRPWGAPAAALGKIERTGAALTAIADDLDGAAHEMKGAAQLLRDATQESKRHLAAMRQTPIRGLFGRVSLALETEARRAAKRVEVRIQGGDELIDRRLAEALGEPVLQLARNALAHGIETPRARAAAGKREVALVSLAAKRVGGRLHVSISDDGAGVNLDVVRQRAVDEGILPEAVARAADANTLLTVLFLPNFSTRPAADLLAGRGIGLDIALASVQRLAGTIRLSSVHGEGLVAHIEVPMEAGIACVLWVTCSGVELALLADAVRRVARVGDVPGAVPPIPLCTCLDGRPPRGSRLALELELGEGDGRSSVHVGVDEVSRTEEVLLRPLTALVASLGPYAGVVARGDGTLRLVIDTFRLGPQVRAMAAG